MITVGIIGFGSFGQFTAQKLDGVAEVRVYSRSNTDNQWIASLEDVAQSDYVILTVPLGSYRDVVTSIKPYLRSDSVVIDVCSVKAKPAAILHELLPGQPIVATHPMFGPESAGESHAGHSFIMCPEVSDAAAYEAVKSFAIDAGLRVIELSAEEHDREIAIVQGLTFFVARAVDQMGISDQMLHTPSFSRLLSLADLERHHSSDLFETIQNGNTHTAAVRERFIETAQQINNELEQLG